MSKQFIKVTATYSAKTRVAALISNNLQEFNHSLVAKKLDATNLIRNGYQRAIRQHTGSGSIPPLKEHEVDNAKVFEVENVIKLTVYEVVNDFSH